MSRFVSVAVGLMWTLNAWAGVAGIKDTINPGDEENLGYLLTVAPEGAATSTPGFGRIASLTLGTEPVTVGTPLRTLAGTRCLQLGNAYFATQDCAVSITARQTTTYKLAGLLAHWDPNRLAVDFGPTLELRLSAGGSRLAPNYTWPANPTEILPVLPTSLRFEFAPEWRFDGLGPVDFSAIAGEVRDLDLTPRDEVRAKLLVNFQTKTFPDVPIPCAGSSNSYLLWRQSGHEADAARDGVWGPYPLDAYQRNSSSPRYGITAFRAVTSADAKGIRLMPFTDARYRYEYVVNNMLVPLELVRGRTAQIDLRRIDVNDVKVTEEDGTVYYAHGTYSVARQDPAKPGEWVPIKIPSIGYNSSYCYGGSSSYDTFPTKTGLDVLPGVYRVTLNYATREGAKTQQIQMDLSH